MKNAVALAIAALVFGMTAVTAQAPKPRIWQGVYTAAQAERGKATFLSTCQRCHNADLSGDRGPALKGERFMTSWGGGSVTRLFEKIRDTMPVFATSTIDEKTKLDIVTFILQTNGFPTGDKELVPEDLEAIQIVAEGEQPKVQNFTKVEVVGCLAHGDSDRWVLTSASEPVIADAGFVSSSARPTGTARVVLLNATPFDPAGQVGQRIEARGLIYREGAELLLTVTSLKATGSCPN